MFSTCPFVCPFVPSFVRCLLPTCERYTSKMNEPISMQIGTNWGKGINNRSRGSGGQSSRSQKAKVLFGSLAETGRRHSRSLESSRRVDRDRMSDGNVVFGKWARCCT